MNSEISLMAKKSAVIDNRNIILFDGVCGLCDRSIQFVIAHDHDQYFKFASFQSKAGEQICKKFGLNSGMSTFYLIEAGIVYDKSDAWMKILRRLNAPWRYLSVFSIVPRAIRDWVYDQIGRNRYRWFGKMESCPIPDPSVADRFLA